MSASSDKTFTESPGGSPGLAAPEPHLVVVLECDRPLSGSSRHSLRAVTEVTIGRGPERAAVRDAGRLAVSLPGKWMSAAHASMRLQRDRWLIEDRGSRNGTRVNGEPVAHLALADGDVIEAGHTLFIFRQALHAPPGTPLDFDSRGADLPARGMGTMIPALSGEIDALTRIARSPVSVLLRGETGTGKEVAARAVHALSGRKGAFVPVNCGSIPAALVESQLFGHIKGAFSGAVRDEPGFVRAAGGGTLFLDEIGDLPAASQAALLRVLQEGEVNPVGSTRAVAVDLRVVAATHRPLETLAASGQFRVDLLARIDGFAFVIPALRERREDLGLILSDLMRASPESSQKQTISPEVGRALLRYDWPLNVRELAQCLARAQVLANGEPRLEVSHLPPQVRAVLAPEAVPVEAGREASDALLRTQLEGLLVKHQGNVAEVARALGKARMQVHRWLKRFVIDPDRYRR